MCKLTATCRMCGGEFRTADMIPAPSIRRNQAPAYTCQHCATHNHGYHAQPGMVRGSVDSMGTEKVNATECGIEFESAFTDITARQVFFEYGFIATHDCSLVSVGEGSRYMSPYGSDRNTCEYVSPVFKGLNRPSKFVKTCDRLVAEGHLALNNSCGTHFHVSVNSMKDENGNKTYMDMIRRFYNSLFVPLTEAMQANPEKTKEIFGRYFNDSYAKPITWNSKQDTENVHRDRYYFINCLANNNVEFRINKWVSGTQYQKLMKMEVKMVNCIVNNFCKKFNDMGTGRTAQQTAYRKMRAEKTAEKLVKIFRENW